ncbi:MAG: hypothetical protein M3O20_02155 [Acidobacteriota bacterium]|nr:hypothetical protein [Acidobacteriota bacterium]
MIDLSIHRITRIAIVLGVIGIALALGLRGWRDAVGFLAGAGLSLVTIRSWFKLADAIGVSGGLPAAGSVVFLVVRYLLIAGAVYATIYVLRSSPAVLIIGLLVSFFAVVLELVFGLSVSK